MGDNAHAADPESDNNALTGLLTFVTRLPLEECPQTICLKKLLELIPHGDLYGKAMGIAMEDELSGPLTMNMGVIRMEGERVDVRLNYRYPVTRGFEECGPQVRAAFEGAGFRQDYLLHKPALYMPAEDRKSVV